MSRDIKEPMQKSKIGENSVIKNSIQMHTYHKNMHEFNYQDSNPTCIQGVAKKTKNIFNFFTCST